MKSKDIKGIMHDLLDLRNWRNPLQMVSIPNKIELDLITGEGNWDEEDSLTELLEEKRGWFLDRIKSLKGDIKDFQKAKIIVFVAKEKVKIKYKGKEFEKERVLDPWLSQV